jgi:two-component system response regulator GlrR
MPARKILIIDDASGGMEMMKEELRSASYAVFTAARANEAIQTCKNENFDLCILDLRLRHANGVSLINELRAVDPELPVLVLTDYGIVDSTVKAMNEEADPTKPSSTAEVLGQIQRAMENRAVNSKIQSLKAIFHKEDQPTSIMFNKIVAKSEKMRGVLNVVARIAKTESTVYLHGESGTGKEIIAKAIHLASERRDRPFVAINCAAVPEPLLESELFGHEKGSFTGADRTTRGLFTQAHRGTLLLDEIGDMPMSIQAKFLRVLQERQFYPVGGEKPVAVNVRIVVATNKDLREQVEKRLFRSDLFYRLYVIPIYLPPLRDRVEDILPLANHFLEKACQQMKKTVKGFKPDAVDKLMRYEWPGNIRELENTIEYAVAMTHEDMLGAEFILQSKNHRPLEAGNHAYSQGAEYGFRGGIVKSYKEAKYRFERDYLIYLLELSDGKASLAARLAETSRTDFYELLKKHEIKIETFKRSA